MYDLSNQCQATQEDYRAAIYTCRKKTKAKAQPELSLAGDVLDSKESFLNCVNGRRRFRENDCYCMMLFFCISAAPLGVFFAILSSIV